jgi:hypothetical protein
LPLLVAACSSASTDPLAALTANQIASKAVADLKFADSVHMAGTVPVSGVATTMDGTIAKSACDMSITMAGKGAAQIILIGSSTWLKANAEFLESQNAGAQGQAAAAEFAGRYLKMPASFASNAQNFCSLDGLVKQVTSGNNGGMAKGKTVTIGGQQALELKATDGSIGYVSVSAEPELLRVSKGSDHIDFTEHNAPVTINPPPAGQVVDLAGQ